MPLQRAITSTCWPPKSVNSSPQVAVTGTSEGLERLRAVNEGLASWPQLAWGPAGRLAIATAAEADVIISAIVGVAGLEATYEAVRRGKRVGLANKEVLVAGGKLVMEAVRQHGAELIPVDSEHNGAHQCLRAGNRGEVRRLILTASGGPFRTMSRETMASVTPRQALNHPTWKMGNRITIDSATLMNKGFEVIEACWLFGFAPSEVGRGDSSAVDCACHGRIQRWQCACPDLGDGHANAHTVRTHVSGEGPGPRAEDRLDACAHMGVRTSRFRQVSAVGPGLPVARRRADRQLVR